MRGNLVEARNLLSTLKDLQAVIDNGEASPQTSCTRLIAIEIYLPKLPDTGVEISSLKDALKILAEKSAEAEKQSQTLHRISKKIRPNLGNPSPISKPRCKMRGYLRSHWVRTWVSGLTLGLEPNSIQHFTFRSDGLQSGRREAPKQKRQL